MGDNQQAEVRNQGEEPQGSKDGENQAARLIKFIKEDQVISQLEYALLRAFHEYYGAVACKFDKESGQWLIKRDGGGIIATLDDCVLTLNRDIGFHLHSMLATDNIGKVGA
jgi:hypothetical protein